MRGTHFDRDGFARYVGLLVRLVVPGLVLAGLVTALGLAFGAWAALGAAAVVFAIATWLTFQVPD
jgi:hypothetical protein